MTMFGGWLSYAVQCLPPNITSQPTEGQPMVMLVTYKPSLSKVAIFTEQIIPFGKWTCIHHDNPSAMPVFLTILLSHCSSVGKQLHIQEHLYPRHGRPEANVHWSACGAPRQLTPRGAPCVQPSASAVASAAQKALSAETAG